MRRTSQFEYFKNINNTLKNDKGLQKEYVKVTQKYQKLFINKVLQYAEVKKAGKDISVGGEKLGCTVITVNLDEDAVASIFRDIIAEAKEDKALESVVTKMAANYSFRDDPEDIVEKFYDSLDDAEEDIDKIEDQAIEITFDFYITKSGKRMARVDMEAEVGNQAVEASLILGKNVATSKEIAFEYKDSKTNAGYSISYEVKENTNKKYEATIEIEETKARRNTTSTTEQRIRIEWDKKTTDFDLKYTDARAREYAVKGQLKQKGDTYSFLLLKLINRGQTVPQVKSLELTIVVDRHDGTPNAPGKFTEITKMEERDFKHLADDISDGFKDFKKDYFK